MMGKTKLPALVLAVAFFMAPSAQSLPNSSTSFYGEVEDVYEGDTVRVFLYDGQQIPEHVKRCSKVYSQMAWVRLFAVQAPPPEGRQICGREAKNYLRRISFGQKVRVECLECAKGGGINGLVYLEGPISSADLGMEMARAGLVRVTNGDNSRRDMGATITKYHKAEKEAMLSKLGIWAGKRCNAQ